MSAAAGERGRAGIWHDAHGAQRWEVPELDGSATGPTRSSAAPPPAAPPTAAELEAIHAAAREAGFVEGREAGLAAATEELAAARMQLQVLAAQMAAPLAELDQEVERALANLALSLARRIVGQCVEAQAEALRQLVHRVVSHLGPLQCTVQVQLCPQDLSRLRELEGLDAQWELQPNAELAPGDVLVVHGDTQVDGRLAQRIERLAADMLDGR